MTAQRILFTGGGSAGHVTPNLALMRQLRQEGYEIHYAGTQDGIEHKLIAAEPDVTYHVIQSGKFRRYLSLKNLSDPFRVLRGISQAKKLVKALKPAAVFSKGGFVSVPVVIGAHKQVPVVIHESDYSPGLANKIASRYADAVCVTFEDTLAHVGGKGVFTGTPIRAELYQGSREKGFAFTGLYPGKPVVLMMGGSLGAQAVNDALREALPELLQYFNIVHLCGKGKLAQSLQNQPGYVQYEYITGELPDLFAMADVILSRAGANAVFEFLALQKPCVLIPLPLSASRGDQIQNANYFKNKRCAYVLPQEELNTMTLSVALREVYMNKEYYRSNMAAEPHADGTQAVLDVIRQAARGGL